MSPDSGEPLLETLVKVRKLFVIQTEQVQDGGVQVGEWPALLDGIEPQFVGGADGLAAFDSSPGQPHAEAERVMVSTQLAQSLTRRRSPKFATPDQQRLVPQAGAFQVRHQGSDRLIRFAGMELVIGDAVVVAVPGILDMAAPGVQLDEPDALFQQPAGNQAFAAEIRGQLLVQPIPGATSAGSLSRSTTWAAVVCIRNASS